MHVVLADAVAFRAMAGAYSLAALQELPQRSALPSRPLVRGGSLNRHPTPSPQPLVALSASPAPSSSCAATALAAEALEELELRESSSCDF